MENQDEAFLIAWVFPRLCSARHPSLSRAAFRARPLAVRCQSFQDGERYPAGRRVSQTQIPSAVRSHFRWLEGGEENSGITPPLDAPRPG